jgi:tight adherence protein B
MQTQAMMLVLTITVFAMGLCYLIYDTVVAKRAAGSIDRRIDRLGKGGDGAGPDQFDLMPQEMEKSFFASLLPELPSFGKYVEQADVKYETSQIVLAALGLFAAGAAVPLLLKLPYAWILAASLGGMLGSIPLLYVWWNRRGRLKKFEAQLGEALELVARALRAGHSLASGMNSVAHEMPQPIAKEFGRVFEEQNLGIPIETALRNLAGRVPNLDLRFFVTAVIIQRTTGGDLAEILDKIGYLIRERFKIMGMVQALTGEGRLSGVVLISLPFALLLTMMYISPGYVDDLWLDDMGRQMSMGAMASMAFGAWWINKIVNIKI